MDELTILIQLTYLTYKRAPKKIYFVFSITFGTARQCQSFLKCEFSLKQDWNHSLTLPNPNTKERPNGSHVPS